MRFLNLFFRRFYSRNVLAQPKVCIVGAGTAGFYAAQHLLKKFNNSEIDIYEKLPVPYGLVRFGVAPDHPEVKNVENTFNKTAQQSNVRFIGNVSFGSDISLSELRKAYHVVLLTYGAEENRKLNIPGENLTNVLPARNIVGWYNGTPWDACLNVDLSGEVAAIIGQGNVAIDVARILLSPVDELRKTDITQHALDALAQSNVKTVYLIGRRGPLQAAFTIKELREMLNLKGCKTVWNLEDFKGISNLVSNLPRPKKRITELMLKSLNSKSESVADKIFRPVFFRAPLEIIGKQKVEQIKLGVTKLEGDDLLNKTAVMTDKSETLPCDLVVTSIGYKSLKVDAELPFDERRGVIKNDYFKVDRGVFASGWVSTGPTGVILTTMSNAFASADEIIKYIETENLLSESKPGYEHVDKVLQDKNVQVVTWKDWLKIDKYEQLQGEKLNKPREKVIDLKEMLKIAAS